ncbi:MAG: hypothetical protein L6408_07995 [Nanoarchaeota archaeon]|nr:hypothetical protein [Nanoarchaeota archaeon]
MKNAKPNTEGKLLKDYLPLIDPSLKFKQFYGEGSFGMVMRTNKDNEDYRLKISKIDPETGNYYPLDDEYQKLEDLVDSGVTPKPVNLYDNVPAAYIDKESMPYKFFEGNKGQNAYTTKVIEGKALFEADKLNRFSLERSLRTMLDKIHAKGYEFRLPESDINGKNILLGNDGKLYLIDPMMLTKRDESAEGLTDEERIAIDRILTIYGEKW